MVQRKSSLWAMALAVLILGASTAKADDLSSLLKKKEVEVRLRDVFVPRVGFDDNDRVEVVLAGDLPSPCFTLDRAYAEKTPDGKGFRVHQIAWMWNSGACATGDLIEDPVPFVMPVLLGQLNASSYQVEFLSESGSQRTREFSVARTQSDDIDNFSYATVRSVDMEEGYDEGKMVTAKLRGLLPDRCSELSQPPKINVEGNVVIVLPVLTKRSHDCTEGTRSFQKTIQIGTLKPGQYLLHVRSRGGNAVYRPFTVWEKK